MIEQFYENELSWNDKIATLLGKRHSHIDPILLDRTPKLSFNDDGKINIDIMYPPESEVRPDSSPYDEYYNCIKETFNLSEIDSFCDIGCATGHLVYNMVNHANSCGIEYFQYHKDKSNPFIKDSINIFDIRDPFEDDNKFDLVNCTEVAEHVDPKYLHIFLDNIKKITGKYLILTWSGTYPPQCAPPQHVSPLPKDDVEKLMNEWGFQIDIEKTNKFLSESTKYSNFYFWWRESLSVWVK